MNTAQFEDPPSKAVCRTKPLPKSRGFHGPEPNQNRSGGVISASNCGAKGAKNMAVNRLAILVLTIWCTSAVAAEPFPPRTRPRCLSGIPWADYQYRPRSPSETAISRLGIMLRTKTSVQEAANRPTVALRQQYRGGQVLRGQPAAVDMLLERRIDESIVPLRIEELPSPDRAAPDLELLNDLQPPVARRVLIDDCTRQMPSATLKETVVVELYQLYTPRLKIDQCEISQVALQLRDDGYWILSLRADQNRRPAEEEAAEYNPQLYIKRNQFHVRLRCLGAFKEAFEKEPGEAALAVGRPVLATLEPCAFWVQNGQPRYVRTGDWNACVAENFEDIDRVEIEFFYYKHNRSVDPRGEG
jgi:hypothetical protein